MDRENLEEFLGQMRAKMPNWSEKLQHAFENGRDQSSLV